MSYSKILINPNLANNLVQIATIIYKTDPLEIKRSNINVMARTAISVQMRKSNETFAAIGEFLNKDHSAIVHCVSKHDDRMQYDKEYQYYYSEFFTRVENTLSPKQIIFAEMRHQIQRISQDLITLGYNWNEIADHWKQCVNEI